MLTNLDYLSVQETRPGGDLRLVWHELGNPVSSETVAPIARLQKEEGPTLQRALERVLRSAEPIDGPVWIQFDEKSPPLPAFDWEGFVYSAVAKPVSRVRKWTLPSFRRSPLGSVLTLLADSAFDNENASLLNELVDTAHGQGEACVVATTTPQAVQRVAEYEGESPFEHFVARLAVEKDLKSSLSELRSSFETLFVVADPWWSDGEPGLRIGDDEFSKFVAAPEIVRTAARMGAARLVLVTSLNKCAEISRLLAHRAAAEAPIDVDLLVLEKSSAADSVRAYLASLFEGTTTVENYDPARVIRYASPFNSRPWLERVSSGDDWIQFTLAYLAEYTVAGKLGSGQISLDAAWALPVQRVFEKYAAMPFELLVERGIVPESQDGPGGSWTGVLQALKNMKRIFGEDEEPDGSEEMVPRFAR